MFARFCRDFGSEKARIDSAILAGEIIVGSLPPRALQLVRDWAKLHADELTADWELAVSEEPLNPIDPLH
jgi:hypothetical protein